MKKLIYLITLKPSSHRTAEENLGIQYLASVLMSNGYIVKIRASWLDNSITTEYIYSEIISDKDEVLFVGTSSYMLNNKCTCELIKKLKKTNKNVDENIFIALSNINLNCVLGYKKDGEKHNFTDEYK